MTIELHSALKSGTLLRGVGARDALEARLIEKSGFEFVWISSLAVSASFGLPDAGLVSHPKILERCREIGAAVDVPLILDSDIGYNELQSVSDTVNAFESVGINGVSLEDKILPKTNSLSAASVQALADRQQFAHLVNAVVSARHSKEFIVLARVEALVAGAGCAEALIRAQCYAEAGADAIIIHSRASSPDQVLEFVHQWDGRCPLGLIPTTYPTLTESAIAELPSVRMVIYANQVLRAGVKAQEEILEELRCRGGAHTIGTRIISMERLFDIQAPRVRSRPGLGNM